MEGVYQDLDMLADHETMLVSPSRSEAPCVAEQSNILSFHSAIFFPFSSMLLPRAPTNKYYIQQAMSGSVFLSLPQTRKLFICSTTQFYIQKLKLCLTLFTRTVNASSCLIFLLFFSSVATKGLIYFANI